MIGSLQAGSCRDSKFTLGLFSVNWKHKRLLSENNELQLYRPYSLISVQWSMSETVTLERPIALLGTPQWQIYTTKFSLEFRPLNSIATFMKKKFGTAATSTGLELQDNIECSSVC